MTTAAAKAVFTPDDLLTLPDSVNYELVDGNLVERHMGSESSAIGLAIGVVLANFVKAKRLGHVFNADCGYQCFPGFPDRVRKPDVSFIRMGRLPGERIPEGHTRIPPDLAVEVVSPGDLAYEVDEKIEQYLTAGVRLIWVVSPKTRSVRIHRPKDAPQGPIGALTESDNISGEDVLPGFECPVTEFFQI
jgi:Uma2 family endonuclease